MTKYRTTRARGTALPRHSTRRRGQATALVVYGANVVLELLRSGEPIERLHVGGGPREVEVVTAARVRGVPVEWVDRGSLDRVAGSPQHQGVVALTPPYRYAELQAIVGPERLSALVLDGVQDPRNLGAILRTARAAGIGGVVLPADRSAGVTPVVVGASAGLLFGLRIARVPNLVRAMGELKEAGFWLVGLVPRDGRPLYSFDPPARPAVVIGGEGEGLRPLIRLTCDFAVTIPMAPGVESLNTAVAASLCLYELLVRPQQT